MASVLSEPDSVYQVPDLSGGGTIDMNVGHYQAPSLQTSSDASSSTYAVPVLGGGEQIGMYRASSSNVAPGLQDCRAFWLLLLSLIIIIVVVIIKIR
jgi:hypothetical protein